MADWNSELIIGFVTAVGTEVSPVTEVLRERLASAGYQVETVKVSSDVIPLICPPAPHSGNYLRISNAMDAGNEARSKTGDDSILAFGVATRILAKRKEAGCVEPPQALSKTAIIIDSLKRPEEVERLREIYPSGFVLVGIHESEDRRMRRLVDDVGMTPEQADKLMVRDSEESQTKHGQRVNNTFHLADFFVEVTANRDQLRGDVKRIVDLWFGNPFITPTFDEHAMFLAFSSALRSADLSRQVGAVVARDSQVLATGANECPKAGGGLYWPARNNEGCIEDVKDGRDYLREDGDSNRAEQIRIIERIVKQAEAEGYGFNLDDLRKLLQDSGIRDLTEYGRVVHAEMEALLSCARNGLPTVDATLYCTTFPCHNCAKHIIAAGIERVVYVEPYTKSKTRTFHNDSIWQLGWVPTAGEKRVKFEPFVGVGPRRFFDLFSMSLSSGYRLNRKDSDSGKRQDWRIEDARLRIQMRPASYLEQEATACRLFGKKMEETK